MPINPNIALGIQQPQPVNMLGQMGQAMALKAAQQEMQSNEEMRNLFSGGANFDDPEFQRRGYQANPKQFQDLLGKRATTQKTEIEALTNEIKLRRDALSDVNTPEDYLNWHEKNHEGRIGSFFKSIGVNPSRESIVTQLNQPGGFAKLKQASALGATELEKKLMDEARAVKVANIGAGPGYQRNALEREKMEFERANPVLSRVDGENGFYLYNPRDPNSAVPLGMRPSALPAAAPAATAAPANGLLMTTQPTATNLNAFTGGSPNQAGPTVANAAAQAAAAAAQPTIIKPKQTIRQPVAVIKDGVVTLVPPEQAVGMTPATPGAEKALEKTVIAKEGKESVNRVLGTLYSEYSSLVKSGGITDTRRSMEENIAARTGASGVGQLTGSFTGSEAQSFRDTIEQTRPLLLTAIMKATGLSATQLNSNVELQTYLKTATDPKVSIQSNVKALNNISTMFGIGEKFEVPEIKTSKSANPADAPPPGLSPEIAKLWQFMPAEDRKLWQK